jgi:hypothetical protein
MLRRKSRDSRAEYLSRREGIIGPIAFSRNGALSAETPEDAQLLKQFGGVPNVLPWPETNIAQKARK